MRRSNLLAIMASISISALICLVFPLSISNKQVAGAISIKDISGGGESNGNRIIAGVQFGSPPENTSDQSGCTWRLYFDYSNSNTPPPADPPEAVEGGISYTLWIKDCPFGWEPIWIPNIDTQTLAKAASSRLSKLIPTPQLSSAPPANRMVVGLGTWIWASQDFWHAVEVTAWIPTPTGIVSVTTRAEPISIVFEPGDGVFGTGSIACRGPGSQWLPIYGDVRSSDCMYTYTHSSSLSSDGIFHAALKTVWNLSWESNIGLSGDLPDVTTTDAVGARVRELQALAG